MKEISNEELKKAALDILVYIDAFCKARNITYWAIGGTLLGAVRHQGFIPWDDDIDICMPYEDYIKFISDFSGETGRYQLASYPQRKDYHIPFAKVIDTDTVLYEKIVRDYEGAGVFVDIFPICGLPEDPEAAKALICGVSDTMKYHYLVIGKDNPVQKNGNPVKRAALGVFRLMMKVDSHYFQKKMMKTFALYPFNGAKLAGCPVGAYREREVMDAKVFSGTVLLPFEHIQIPVPLGYETYLTKIYGDYMTPPPVEKRMTTHSFQAFWKE